MARTKGFNILVVLHGMANFVDGITTFFCNLAIENTPLSSLVYLFKKVIFYSYRMAPPVVFVGL